MTDDEQDKIIEEYVPANDMLEDYEFSRIVYYKLAKAGLDNVEKLSELVDEMENPRAYEILGGFLKNVADINDKLLDAQRKNQVLRQEEALKKAAQLEAPSQQARLGFTGSTKDLKAALADAADADFTEVEDDGTDGP